MDRRSFLQSLGALILWRHPWLAATTPTTQPIIFDYEDGGYLIAVDCLRCTIYPDSCTGSVLNFHVWVTDYPVPGMIRERLMLPSEILKKKLEEVGFPSRLEDDVWPFVVARMTYFLTPAEVGKRLQQIVRGWDSSLLYYAPDLDQEAIGKAGL
jgi:hypothetical protein